MPIDAASAILETLWHKKGIPVDPAVIAKSLGLRVLESSSLGDKISGALIKKADEDPVILLNANDSNARKRFTCAHEIGHYIRRVEKRESSYETIDYRGTLAAQGCDKEEIFANQFAANLLMPEDSVRNMHADGVHPSIMAVTFGVSDDAMRFRLMNLQIAGRDD